MAEKDINLKQVLKRFPPGDRWTPTDNDQPVFSNLTEGIEWVFQSTNERDYVIKAAEGKVFIYHLFFITPTAYPPTYTQRYWVNQGLPEKISLPKRRRGRGSGRGRNADGCVYSS